MRKRDLQTRAETSATLLAIATPVLAGVCALAIWMGHPLAAMTMSALLLTDFVDHLVCQARIGRPTSRWTAPIAAMTIIATATAAFASLG